MIIKWIGTTPKYALSNGLTASTPEMAIAMRLFEDSTTRSRIKHEKETADMHRKQASKVAYEKELRADTDSFWSLINNASSSQAKLAGLANKLGCEAILAYINRFGKEKEFAAFEKAVKLTLQLLPQLKAWLIRFPMKLVKNLEHWADILKVCQYFLSGLSYTSNQHAILLATF